MFLGMCTCLIKLDENNEVDDHVAEYVQTPDQVAEYLHTPDQIG